MSEYATKGAQLVCTGGTAPSKLQVTSHSLLEAQGNPVATTSDKAPMANIMSFGDCKLKPKAPPCIPAPAAWTGFLTSLNVPGGNPLLNTSKIQCACGGMISFQNSGQMKSTKVIINPSSPQIEALKKAAINATPFCEECEKKEPGPPKITRIYWVDENNEQWDISTLYPGQVVTLCVDVEGIEPGKNVDLKLMAKDERKFKGGKTELSFSATVDDDLTAYVDDFSIEYE